MWSLTPRVKFSDDHKAFYPGRKYEASKKRYPELGIRKGANCYPIWWEGMDDIKSTKSEFKWFKQTAYVKTMSCPSDPIQN